MKFSKTQKNTEFTKSNLTSNVSKMISYLGVFPTFEIMSGTILKEIEEVSLKNRAEAEKMKTENGAIGDSESEFKQNDFSKIQGEEDMKAKTTFSEAAEIREIISDTPKLIFQLRRYGRNRLIVVIFQGNDAD